MKCVPCVKITTFRTLYAGSFGVYVSIRGDFLLFCLSVYFEMVLYDRQYVLVLNFRGVSRHAGQRLICGVRALCDWH
jgi:hypothetical protein